MQGGLDPVEFLKVHWVLLGGLRFSNVGCVWRAGAQPLLCSAYPSTYYNGFYIGVILGYILGLYGE